MCFKAGLCDRWYDAGNVLAIQSLLTGFVIVTAVRQHHE